MGQVPILDPEEHMDRANAALEAARKASARIREQFPSGMPSNITEQSAYLGAHAEYLDLMQIVNTHANMATAKALLQMNICDHGTRGYCLACARLM